MINLTENSSVASNKTAVALGVFDGIHRGHQAVINRAVSFKEKGLSPAVFTFNTKTVTSKGNGKIDMLISDELKLEKLEELGVEYVYSPQFSEIKGLTAERFVKEIIVDKFKAEVVVCGENFRFGKGAFAGSAELAKLCENYNIETVVVPFTMYHGQPISSTEIRRLIREGSVDIANYLLGYDFHFRIKVIHGNAVGKMLNFPTINQKFLSSHVIPRFGVYASQTKIEGKLYPSITNVGVKPTIGGESSPLAETYIIDFSGDLYGQMITVYLKKFLRPEKKFNGLDDLKNQLVIDLEKAKEYLYFDNTKGGFYYE